MRSINPLFLTKCHFIFDIQFVNELKMKAKPYYINLNGKLHDLSVPRAMGILNVTPDSFFGGSRYQTEKSIAQRAVEIAEQGGWMIDVGAYSSRPQSVDIPEEEEWSRLGFALEIIGREAPGIAVSVDTFRSGIARRSVEEFGVAMINDISGGELDASMFETIARLRVPYVMMHMRGTPQTMQQHCLYDNLLPDILLWFSRKLEKLHLSGVCDVLIDPGFGFSKTPAQNFELLGQLNEFRILEMPLLVGLSRKSMIYKTLDITPEESLNGTTALNTVALMQGASVLRVHDVKEAVETIRLYSETFLKNE